MELAPASTGSTKVWIAKAAWPFNADQTVTAMKEFAHLTDALLALSVVAPRRHVIALGYP